MKSECQMLPSKDFHSFIKVIAIQLTKNDVYMSIRPGLEGVIGTYCISVQIVL